jgi:hypothetical protein|tara:strand:- start:645 stop:809 length:165 start_codon:yes stop_codon:yes gene_type:complete
VDKALDLIIESSYAQIPNHIVQNNNSFPNILRYVAYALSLYGVYRVIKHFKDEK